MKGKLRKWCEDILFSERLKEHQLFNQKYLTEEWQKFQNNKISNYYRFWDIIIFQNWYEKYF